MPMLNAATRDIRIFHEKVLVVMYVMSLIN